MPNTFTTVNSEDMGNRSSSLLMAQRRRDGLFAKEHRWETTKLSGSRDVYVHVARSTTAEPAASGHAMFTIPE